MACLPYAISFGPDLPLNAPPGRVRIRPKPDVRRPSACCATASLKRLFAANAATRARLKLLFDDKVNTRLRALRATSASTDIGILDWTV